MTLKEKALKSIVEKDFNENESLETYRGFLINPDDASMFQSKAEVDAYAKEIRNSTK